MPSGVEEFGAAAAALAILRFLADSGIFLYNILSKDGRVHRQHGQLHGWVCALQFVFSSLQEEDAFKNDKQIQELVAEGVAKLNSYEEALAQFDLPEDAGMLARAWNGVKIRFRGKLEEIQPIVQQTVKRLELSIPISNRIASVEYQEKTWELLRDMRDDMQNYHRDSVLGQMEIMQQLAKLQQQAQTSEGAAPFENEYQRASVPRTESSFTDEGIGTSEPSDSSRSQSSNFSSLGRVTHKIPRALFVRIERWLRSTDRFVLWIRGTPRQRVLVNISSQLISKLDNLDLPVMAYSCAPGEEPEDSLTVTRRLYLQAGGGEMDTSFSFMDALQRLDNFIGASTYIVYGIFYDLHKVKGLPPTYGLGYHQLVTTLITSAEQAKIKLLMVTSSDDDELESMVEDEDRFQFRGGVDSILLSRLDQVVQEIAEYAAEEQHDI